jgi:hypothetical protein
MVPAAPAASARCLGGNRKAVERARTTAAFRCVAVT